MSEIRRNIHTKQKQMFLYHILNETVQLLAAEYSGLLKVRSENWPKSWKQKASKAVECGSFLHLTYFKVLYAVSQYNEPCFPRYSES